MIGGRYRPRYRYMLLFVWGHHQTHSERGKVLAARLCKLWGLELLATKYALEAAYTVTKVILHVPMCALVELHVQCKYCIELHTGRKLEFHVCMTCEG